MVNKSREPSSRNPTDATAEVKDDEDEMAVTSTRRRGLVIAFAAMGSR